MTSILRLASSGSWKRARYLSNQRSAVVPLVLAGLLVGTSIPPFEMLYCHAASFFFS
jgi:hypothetical protein